MNCWKKSADEPTTSKYWTPWCALFGPPVLSTPLVLTIFGFAPNPFQPFIGHVIILFPILVCTGVSKDGLINWFREVPLHWAFDCKENKNKNK